MAVNFRQVTQPSYNKLFIEVSGGVWKSAGYATLQPGQSNSDFWSCNNTGRSLVFYREEGSNDRMPNEADVQNRM